MNAVAIDQPFSPGWIRGRVEFYNIRRGYGFIRPQDGRGNCLFGFREFDKNSEKRLLHPTLDRMVQATEAGDEVEFYAVLGAKGWRAESVRVLEGAHRR